MKKYNLVFFNIALFLRALMLLQPVMLLFYQENGLNSNDLFFFSGVFYLCSILFDIPVGYLSNTKSRKNLLIFAFSIILFISLLWLFFKGYYIILFGEILWAFAKTILDNVVSSYLCDFAQHTYIHTGHAHFTKYLGLTNFYNQLGVSFGAIIGACLYRYYGSSFILITQIFLMVICICLLSTIPNIRLQNEQECTIKEKIQKYINILKEIYNNPSIKYYIYFSGLLGGYSALFAISFQPLMKNSLFPVILFGIVNFLNNFIRSLSGIIVRKWLYKLNIKNLVIPIFILYVFSIMLLFCINYFHNLILNFILILIVCLVIGFQVIFWILHISRIQKMITSEKKGSLMTINNCIAKTFPAIILISSKLYLNKIDLYYFFSIALIVFICFGSYIIYKIRNVNNIE